ncbi:MAG: hypothetical protein ACRBB2_06175 [Nitrosopumilus sp.]
MKNEYNSENYKACPHCGQDQIPFKLDICVCGKQVGKIQYVKNSETFARNYYSGGF